MDQIRSALVTGAGSGIGKAASVALAATGFAVTLVGRRRDRLEGVAAEIKDAGGQALVASADIAERSEVEAAFGEHMKAFGRLDLLFNNAGTYVPGIPIEDVTLDQWNAIVGVNLTGTFFCTQQAFRIMKSQTPQGGRIINNGSVSCLTPRPLSAPYTATKHAITGLTKSIALDGRQYGIAGGQIDIGNAETELASPMRTGALQPDGSVRPEPLIDTQEVADAVVFMANRPLDVNMPFVTIMATTMPLYGRE